MADLDTNHNDDVEIWNDINDGEALNSLANNFGEIVINGATAAVDTTVADTDCDVFYGRGRCK